MSCDKRLVLVLAAALMPVQAIAQSGNPPSSRDAIQALSCDQRAADPDDPDKPAHIPGVRAVVGPPEDAVIRCMAMSLVSAYQKDDPTHNRRSMYQTGRAHEADNKFNEALSSYRSAAARGSAAAMLAIGAMYEAGRGVPANAAEARQWFEKAAAAGHPLAKTRLAQEQQQPQAGTRPPPPPGPVQIVQQPGHLALAARDIVLMGLTFPEYVSGFRRTSIADFEYKQPGLGYGLHYENADAKATVFVYDGRASLLPENLDSRTLQQHFANVRRDVVVSKTYTRVIEGERFDLRDIDGTMRFACAAFDIEQQGKILDDFLCLTLWRDRYVKVRITFPKGERTRAAAEKFMQAWIEAMWPRALRGSAQAMTAERFLQLAQTTDLVRKRCGLQLSAAQESKLAELTANFQARARFSDAHARAFRATLESRIAAAGDRACDSNSRYTIDAKAVVETMLGK